VTEGDTLAASLFVHLPAGALRCDDFDHLAVHWRLHDKAFDTEGGKSNLEDLVSRFTDADFHLILSVADVLMTEVQLTRQQGRHLSRVMPFLLEERLLDDPADLMFVSGRGREGNYPVVALRQADLGTMVAWCQSKGMQLVQILVDADLLAAKAPCLWRQHGEWLLLTADKQALVMDDDAVALFLRQGGAGDDAEGGSIGVDHDNIIEIDDATAWQQLILASAQPHIELMQNNWRVKRQGQVMPEAGLWAHWRPTLVASGIICCLIWFCAGVQYFRYQAASRHWDQQAASLFQELFPQDRATAKLRAQFRGHLLRLQQGAGSAGGFLPLMEAAGPVLAQEKPKGITPQRIQYDQLNGQLMLDIDASNYQILQELRDKLQAAHLQAAITVAKTQGKSVSARIRVEQG
jgi:general secretion pathway protein L